MVGIMFCWEIEDLIFLEHFSTLPTVRGKGIGAKALEILKSKGKTILLEIEPPEDDITIRRYNFYQRNGFLMNPYHHVQAKYHLGDEDCELKILSYPSILSPEQYRGFYEYMTREIGIAPHKAEEYTVRPMIDGDDVYQIAKLIYLTDPYIYPLWFDSMEQGIRIISEIINLPTLYNKDNIMVAVDDNNHIAGITVSCQSPFCEKIDYIKQTYERAGEKMDERSNYIFDNYYALMGKAEDGYYINYCTNNNDNE